MGEAARARGDAIARLLVGSWRPEPPQLTISAAEVAGLVPRLVDTRSAGLAWWRLRTSSLASDVSAAPLRDAYRFHALEAVWRERDLAIVLSALRDRGVEPLLSKGWSLTQLYPRPAVRPYLDLDLAVPAEHERIAHAVLASRTELMTPVDLHVGFPSLPDRRWNELVARSIRVPLADESVHVLGPEDHLRLVCDHFARHGGCRPMWLADVAALLEHLPVGFDWDWCLHGRPAISAWVLATLRLAHQLLGARLPDLPALRRAPSLPTWLVPAVLGAWGSEQRLADHRPVAELLMRPSGLMWTARERWPNPLAGTAQCRQAPVRWPLPYQLAWYLRLATGWVGRLSRGGAGPRPLPLALAIPTSTCQTEPAR